MITWIIEPGVRKTFVLWIYGPAGSGKTAIQQTIAELCNEMGILAASFFFSRTGIGRSDTSRFIPTLAYQLCFSNSALRDRILRIVKEQPSIFSSDLLTQMNCLIIIPMKEATALNLIDPSQDGPQVVIVDGLDEAQDENSHAELLQALVSCNEQIPHALLFIVATRPEYTIRRSFRQNPLQSITQELPLDNHYIPDADIRIFLESEFCNIRKTHPSGRRMPPSWPDKKSVSHLVAKSSGQFVYASTVMKYIGSPRHNPVRNLQFICNLSCDPGSRETPYAQLDALYHMILTSVDDA